jgi:alpha-beta hydrolase superfamily lysophospholipase
MIFIGNGRLSASPLLKMRPHLQSAVVDSDGLSRFVRPDDFYRERPAPLAVRRIFLWSAAACLTVVRLDAALPLLKMRPHLQSAVVDSGGLSRFVRPDNFYRERPALGLAVAEDATASSVRRGG